MVLGGKDANTAVVVGIAILVVHREHRDGGKLRVGREIGRDVQDGAKRDVAKVGRRSMVSDHAVGQHRERMRVVAAEDADSEDAQAAASVDMVDEHELATIGVRF